MRLEGTVRRPGNEARGEEGLGGGLGMRLGGTGRRPGNEAGRVWK